MNKLEYPEVSLYKLRLLSKGEESLIATRRDEKQHFYNVSLDTIGNYYSLLNEENLNILVPVIIESVAQNKCRLNIESDGVRVKPLVTVKSDWGEYADSAERLIPRIDLLPLNIIKE